MARHDRRSAPPYHSCNTFGRLIPRCCWIWWCYGYDPSAKSRIPPPAGNRDGPDSRARWARVPSQRAWGAVTSELGLKRLFISACLACLLLLPLGIAFQDIFSQKVVTISIALTVVVCSIALLLPITRQISISAGGVALAGGLSGAMLGLTGIGGPPMVLYLLASLLDPRLVSSFLMLYVSLISLLMILASTAYFQISLFVMLVTLALSPVFFLGTMLSSRYVHHLNPKWVRKISLLFLCLANGSFLILQI